VRIGNGATELDARGREIAANLQAVTGRIGGAARAAGRDPASVRLVAVTKTFGVDDVRRLAALGVTDVGENRDQEAAPKAAAVPALRWHFIGQLQRNKARSVASYASCVHSVDRVRLVAALDLAAQQADRTLDICLQLRLDDDPAHGGAASRQLPALADLVEEAGSLRLAGVMCVPPSGADPDSAFAAAAAIAADLRRTHPTASMFSAGMSGDLEAAIRNGATHVRVGTALLGGREHFLG